MRAMIVISMVAFFAATTAVVTVQSSNDASAPHGTVNATDGDPFYVTPTD